MARQRPMSTSVYSKDIPLTCSYKIHLLRVCRFTIHSCVGQSSQGIEMALHIVICRICHDSVGFLQSVSDEKAIHSCMFVCARRCRFPSRQPRHSCQRGLRLYQTIPQFRQWHHPHCAYINIWNIHLSLHFIPRPMASAHLVSPISSYGYLIHQHSQCIRVL